MTTPFAEKTSKQWKVVQCVELSSVQTIYIHSITEMRDGCLCIKNDSKAAFNFTISRNRKLIAMVEYTGDDHLLVNTNWRINSRGVQNREIHTNPDLNRSQNLHIDVRMEAGIGRIDLKVDESGCAACVFSNNELLFVRMNGNRVVPKLEGFIEQEIYRRVAKVKDDIGRKYLLDWANSMVPPFESFVADLD